MEEKNGKGRGDKRSREVYSEKVKVENDTNTRTKPGKIKLGDSKRGRKTYQEV